MTQWRQRYGNLVDFRKVKSFGGRASKFEAQYEAELELRKKAGDIKDYQAQVQLEVTINGNHVFTKIVDYKVTYPDDSIEWVEVKGFPTDVYLLKRKIMLATYFHAHPQERYLEVRKGKTFIPKIRRKREN